MADRWRTLGWALALVLLMGWWTRQERLADDGYVALTRTPEESDGEPLVLPLVRVVSGDETRFTVEKGPLTIVVNGPVGSAEPGDVISLGATFRADGSVDPTWRSTHPLRGAKKALSLIGLFGGLALVPLWLRREGGRLRVA